MPDRMLTILRAEGAETVAQRLVRSADGEERWEDVPEAIETRATENRGFPSCSACAHARRWLRKRTVTRTSQCLHAEAELPRSWDTFGGRWIEDAHCTVWRMRLGGGACGEEGRLFESRPPEAEEARSAKAKRAPGRRQAAGFIKEPRWKFGALDVGQQIEAKGGIDASALRAAAAGWRKRHPGWDYRTARVWESEVPIQTVVRTA